MVTNIGCGRHSIDLVRIWLRGRLLPTQSGHNNFRLFATKSIGHLNLKSAELSDEKEK